MKESVLHRRPATRGFSIIEALVAAGIMSLVLLAVLRSSNIFVKQQAQISTTLQFDQISSKMVGILKNDVAWSNTTRNTNNATTFNCLLNNNCTSNSVGGYFRVFDIANSEINGGPSTAGTLGPYYYGFTSRGTACANGVSFSPSGSPGNDGCPFGLSFSWQPMCPSAVTCTAANMQMLITGAWTYNPATPQRTIAFNSGKYSFQVMRGGTTAGFNLQPYTSKGVSSFTVPPGVNNLIVEVWGAGGSGCNANNGTSWTGGGGAGGGGAYSYCIFNNVMPGQVFTVNVGAGGPFVAAPPPGLLSCNPGALSSITGANYTCTAAGGAPGGSPVSTAFTGSTIGGFAGAGGLGGAAMSPCPASGAACLGGGAGEDGNCPDGTTYTYSSAYQINISQGGSSPRGGAGGIVTNAPFYPYGLAGGTTYGAGPTTQSDLSGQWPGGGGATFCPCSNTLCTGGPPPPSIAGNGADGAVYVHY